MKITNIRLGGIRIGILKITAHFHRFHPFDLIRPRIILERLIIPLAK